jgi:nitroreductase
MSKVYPYRRRSVYWGMNFGELVEKRRSVRSYLADPVQEEDIAACLEAARLAPSACNAQPWHFIVVADPDRRTRLAELSRLPGSGMNRFVAEAPVIVALLAVRPNISSRVGGFLKGKPFQLIDVGIAAEHFCLAAAERGLGTCMLGWFGEKKVKRLLGVPGGTGVALLITLGYPADTERPKQRKSIREIASREEFHRRW